MNTWEIIGVIIAILTLAGSVLIHLFKTTWWMATLNSSLTSLEAAVKRIDATIAKHEASAYSNVEAAKDFAYRDQRINAAWEKIDSLERIVSAIKGEVLSAITNHQNGCKGFDAK